MMQQQQQQQQQQQRWLQAKLEGHNRQIQPQQRGMYPLVDLFLGGPYNASNSNSSNASVGIAMGQPNSQQSIGQLVSSAQEIVSTFVTQQKSEEDQANETVTAVDSFLGLPTAAATTPSQDMAPFNPTPIDPYNFNVVNGGVGGTANFLQNCFAPEQQQDTLHEEEEHSLEEIMSCDDLYDGDLGELNGDDVVVLPSNAVNDELIVPSAALSSSTPVSVPSSSSMALPPRTNRKQAAGSSHLQWEARYKELIQYVKVFGNTLVPHGWKPNPRLASWVKRQRYQYKLKKDGKGKRSSLTDERISKLQSIGFVWSTHTEHWDEKLNELAIYARYNGNCNVPSKYPPNRQLSIWVRCQRRQYKLYVQQKDQLKKQQQQQSSGQEESPYEQYYNNVEEKDSNKTNSSMKQGQPTPLITPTSSMTEERIQKLKAIGFEFNPRNLKLV